MGLTCPACGDTVEPSEIVCTETPEEFEELLVEDPPELPVKYKGAVRCYGRTVHLAYDCARCHEKHVN